MNNTEKYLPSLCLLLLLSACQGNKTSSSTGPEKTGIQVNHYVSSVQDTAAFLLSGEIEGKKIDYIISSEPVIYACENNPNKKTNLSLYQNVSEEYGKKFHTDGFPQAGLFIKTSLAKDASQKGNIESFLKTFDEDVKDIVNGATKATAYMNSFNADASAQTKYFGFESTTISHVQENNSLSFLTQDKNPKKEDYNLFSSLGIQESSFAFSEYYSSEIPENTSLAEALNFQVTSPMGAPALTMARYAGSSSLSLTQPVQAKAAFSKGESDFILFDSINGSKLAKANGGNYELVRMVTFGNLYVLSTGNDKNSIMENSDNILGYGQGLIPDLAFQAVYGENEGQNN